MAIFTKKKLIGFLMDLVLWTIVAMKKLPDTEKTSNRPQKKVLPILFTKDFVRLLFHTARHSAF